MEQLQIIDKATENFYKWELRGRGWHNFLKPVHLEPVYVPFFPIRARKTEVIDDALAPNLLARIGNMISGTKGQTDSENFDYEEAVKDHYEYRAYYITENHSNVILTINLPSGSKVHSGSILELLTMLTETEQSISFEIIGNSLKQRIQVVCSQHDALRVKLQLKGYYPEAYIEENGEIQEFYPEQNLYTEFVEFGLKNEFTVPIKGYNKQSSETYKSFFSLLDNLHPAEEITLQIMFQGTLNPWNRSIIDSITTEDGKCFFLDAPEMLLQAKEKTSSPLFAVALRGLVKTLDIGRIDVLKNELTTIICNQSNSFSNQLIPLNSTHDLEFDLHLRVSNRLGMILNTEELANFVHFPDTAQLIGNLYKNARKTRAVPKSFLNHEYILGENTHLNKTANITLDTPHRLRHIHIIGSTGTGKSTLLTKLINQDINLGNGLALIDPHGDLVESILKLIPQNRIQDVVIIDPSDTEFPIGINILQAETEVEKIVLSSDLVSAIKRQSTSWGDQMTTILSNAINAMLESKEGGTLFDLRRFLVEDSFRNRFLKTIEDPTIHHFWNKEYQMLRKNAISPILVRLDTFLRPKIIRNMMAQKKGVDFNRLIEENKIILIKLPQGLIGEENSHLLGSLIVSKIQQAAQARQSISQAKRKPYYLYLDEFQNFITPSMSSILSGSRKYGLGLIMAHQDMEQVSRYDGELANSILTNPATRICFRLGDSDARKLENGFSNFDSKDLQNLSVGEAIAKVDTPDQDFNLNAFTVIESNNGDYSSECIQSSRELYSTQKADVEKYIFGLYSIPSIEKSNDRKIIPAEEIEAVPSEKIKVSSPDEFERQKTEYLNKVESHNKTKEHQYLQNFIKKVAESKGFKAVIEEPINNGESRVDIGLCLNGLRVAVEISVTNTSNYETGNILKSLNSGFSKVIMCSNNPKKIEAIKEIAERTIEAEILEKVYFLSPTQLFEYLDRIIVEVKPEKERRIKGYRVKVTYK